VTANAGQSEAKGVELALTVRPVEGLSIDNNVNYIDSRYTDYPGASCLHQVAPYSTPYEQGTACAAATNNLKGVPLGFVPQWSGNTTINYITPIMDGLKLDVTGSVEWRTKMWLSPQYALPYGLANGMEKYHLRIAVGAEDDSWTLALVGRNLTNTLTSNSNGTLWNLEAGKVETAFYLDETRNISIQGTVRF
jgi:iron complex outermembrane receptor protein